MEKEKPISTSQSIEKFINNLKINGEKLSFDFFHPFFSIMLIKNKICNLIEIYFDKIEKNMFSLFNIKISYI